jgi:hypothetical protein
MTYNLQFTSSTKRRKKKKEKIDHAVIDHALKIDHAVIYATHYNLLAVRKDMFSANNVPQPCRSIKQMTALF